MNLSDLQIVDSKLQAFLATARTAFANEPDIAVSRCSDSFNELLNSRDVEQLFAGRISELERTPNHLPREARDGILVLADEKFFMLYMWVFDGRSERNRTSRITTMLSDSLVGNLSDMNLSVRTHKLPVRWNPENFAGDIQLSVGVSHNLAKHESIELSASKDVPQFSSGGVCVLLRLASKQHLPLVWTFDTTELRAVMCASSHISSSRLQTAAEMLRSVAIENPSQTQDVLELLAAMTNNEAFFVRWTALRCMAAIDAEFAMPFLVRAQSDSCGEVSSAAKRAVARLSLQ